MISSGSPPFMAFMSCCLVALKIGHPFFDKHKLEYQATCTPCSPKHKQKKNRTTGDWFGSFTNPSPQTPKPKTYQLSTRPRRALQQRALGGYQATKAKPWQGGKGPSDPGNLILVPTPSPSHLTKPRRDWELRIVLVGARLSRRPLVLGLVWPI